MVSSGVRIGTPALAARGFSLDDFAEVSDVIAAALRPSIAEEELAALRERLDALGARLLHVEQENAALHEQREAALHERDEALHRLDEADERIARADTVLRDVLGSPSWRITKPLRTLKRLSGD
jgi:hypothetical protein